jgi:cytolysin (calcineurin-like family phosphatase)
MKKQIWKVMTFLAALMAASSAAGQTNHGDIPFAFSVANQTVPPGHYTTVQVTSTLLRIFNSHNQGVVVLTTAVDSKESEGTGKMLFHRYGDDYFLSEVWDPAGQSGRKVVQSRSLLKYPSRYVRIRSANRTVRLSFVI